MKFLGNHRLAGLLFVVLAAALFGSDGVRAQQTLNRGFQVTLDATATSEELNSQEDLWVMEVSFKPMRMLEVEVIDPKTGQKKKEYVWYLIYKAVNRPLQRRGATTLRAENDEDPIPTPQFVPEFTLLTEDSGVQKIYSDVIIPEAQKLILQRERRRAVDPIYKNTVEIVGDIPEVTPLESKSENALHGMVMWRSVDSETDYFTVFMTGFTSSYRMIKGPEGEPLIGRRVIQQQFWRPGDRFDQTEREIRRRGEPKWIERPDAPKKSPAPGTASRDRSRKVAEIKWLASGGLFRSR